MDQFQSPTRAGCFRTEANINRNARHTGDLGFTRSHLHKLLGNPLYVGDVTHKGERHKGLHTAIIAEADWNKVKALTVDGEVPVLWEEQERFVSARDRWSNNALTILPQ